MALADVLGDKLIDYANRYGTGSAAERGGTGGHRSAPPSRPLGWPISFVSAMVGLSAVKMWSPVFQAVDCP